MQKHVPTYEEALSLFKEFNQSESLLKHAYCVEGVMRYMARKAGEDEEKWVSFCFGVYVVFTIFNICQSAQKC
jgi:predicted hydrolase (HD superfamily)